MTQVISAITQNYVLLVADRQLTFLDGPKRGQRMDDNACKLVSLCNMSGIGYTGLARIDGIPTHEWIAKTLASERCSDPGVASRLLAERAGVALSSVPLDLRRQTFVIAGWGYIKNLNGLRSCLCVVTNMMDNSGKMLPKASQSFTVLLKALRDNEDLAVHAVGEPLLLERGQRLERNLRKFISKDISPKAALRLLVDEIIHTSTFSNTVGKNVLGLCIPRRAVRASIESGQSVLIATQPNEDAASFCYYNPTHNELQQFGPTITCGGFATTDVKTENDESQNYQSASIRILASPRSIAQSAPRSAPYFKRLQTARSIIAFEFGISADNAVMPGAVYTIPAAIRNAGDSPIVFAKGLSDEMGQEVPPSVQGGAVPAITLGWPTGEWSIENFDPASRIQFAGVVIAPGKVFEFDFGSFLAPKAPVGSTSRSSVVDFSIRFTDAIKGQLLNASGAEFHFPTNVNQTLMFRIAAKSAPSELNFNPARVIDTGTGELISGPVEGSLPVNLSSIFTDTSICKGKPGIATEAALTSRKDL